MSWTSRFPNLGRFSPFTRSPQNSYSSGAPKVSDADFSYITADDLRAHDAASVSAVTDRGNDALSASPVDYGPQRETDLLVLKNKRKEYAVHFAAYSIAKGELTVGMVRDAAAKKMTGGDRSRVKLLHRGRNLKDDGRKCRDEGLKDGSEILCTILELDSDGEEDGSESGEDDDGEGGVVDGQEGGAKKRRNRGKKTKRRNKREAAAAGGQDSRSSTPTDHRTSSNLDVPLSRTSTRTPSHSRQSSPAPQTRTPKSPPTPATPIDKLNALSTTLHSFQPEVDAYIHNPPSDTKQREFEYKRLSETILTQVLLKLDGVETEGDVEARTRRKELVKETQGLLGRLDGVGKGGES